MAQSAVSDFFITKVNNNGIFETNDTLAAEEPLEIRLVYGNNKQREQKSISVTMRTPGNDLELATGFLFTEGIINTNDHIDDTILFSCNEKKENTITLALKEDVDFNLQKLERHFYTSSSCGVCGKSSINAVKVVNSFNQLPDNLLVATNVFYELPCKLENEQTIFESTGGLHASALFDLDGNLLLLREDVGRHNALDKLIGRALIYNLIPLTNHILLLSGRASFELIQKASLAGIRIVAAVGAPSSLAVELAEDNNMTLLGFLRNNRFNVYAGKHRLIF